VNDQPAEKLWAAMKRMAACEKGTLTFKQAVDRVRTIAYREAGTEIPEPALSFYAEEYVAMVTKHRP
jgi:hypothetical protein